ncbi:MAG: hypothetical protein AAF541_23530 [Pseudomonadota bacterium]
MSVESFDPSSLTAALTETVVAQLLSLAADLDPDSPDNFDDAKAHQAELAFTVTSDQWGDHIDALDDGELISLARFFTLMEDRQMSWAAADKSAVIPIVRALKQRKAYSSELTRWIKANTQNKFLPHGSLADLL